MAETVGQHSVAAFTSPVNGTTPIDANTVRGNDNTVRSAYVDHDADPGIHVQSSTLASRPVAGTAGRKWVTVSSGRYQFWYDDGSRWHEVASDAVNVDCLADANLAKGDVIKITGFNNGQNLPTVNKVTSSTDVAFGLVENTVTSGNIVQIVNTGLIEDVDTNGYAVGTILYPNTSGGWTTTKPTSGNYQPAGFVLRGNTNNGVLYVEFSAPRIVERSNNEASTIVLRDASGNFAAGTITAGALTSTGLVTFASLKGTGATTVTNILDEDNMASDSATALATQQSIKAYVDAKVATVDTLAEVLANGNTTGATDIIVTAGQKITTDTIAETTAAAGVTIDSVLLKDNAVTATTFNGTLNGAAPAGSLSGTTLASNVVSSSLTSVGTLANLTVTNPITGSVTGSSGSTTGNAATATALQTARNINGVSFNGTADITVTAAAGTLSGATLASGVTASSLTSVGTLSSLTVSGDLTVDTSTLYVKSSSNQVSIGTTSPASGNSLQVGAVGAGAQAGVWVPGSFNFDGAYLQQATTGGRGAALTLAAHNNSTQSSAWRLSYDNDAVSGALRFAYAGASSSYGALSFTEMVRFDANGNVAVDTNTLYVDAANNRVGIGTASPGSPLDVIRSSTSTTALNEPQIRAINTAAATLNQRVDIAMRWEDGTYNGTGGISMVRESATARSGSLVFSSINSSGDATQAMRLDASGNLGLGVTPSAWDANRRVLQVGGNGALWGQSSGSGFLFLSNNLYYDGTNFRYLNTAASAYLTIASDASYRWNQAASGTAGNAISFTQAMTLDASGNLGVGTASPTISAAATGIDIYDATDVQFRLHTGVSGTGLSDGFVLSMASDNTVYLYGYENAPMIFATNNNERARITSGGYFKASNTGTYVDATGTYHELVSNTASAYTARIVQSNASPGSAAIALLTFTNAAPNDTSAYFLDCTDNAARRAYIRSNGGLSNYQSNNTDLSDARTKTDITPASSMWDKVAALEIVTYKYNDQTHDDVNVGVIAQQVETVEPVWVDSDGWDKETPEGEEPLKTVYTKDITFAAIKALQEAMARIEALEARLEALEA